MSSWYRSPLGRSLLIGLTSTAALSAAVDAHAADTWWQSNVEISAESHDNYDLDPNPDQSSQDAETVGAVADLGGTLGILTPRSDTYIRPRVTLQQFSGRDDVADYEAFLTVLSRYRSERSEFDVVAKYSRRDANNPDARFDDIDPSDPNTPETGGIDTGELRQHYELRPTYAYEASQRLQLGIGANYDGMRYDTQAIATRVDYDYLYGDAFAQWALDPRSFVRPYAFASNYDANDGINQTDAYGAGVGYGHQWSETTGIELDVFYEHDDTTFDVLLPDESSSGWGATFVAYREGEVDKWRLELGRTFTPNSRGSKSVADQIRVQYDRDLSQRMTFAGAVRYIQDERIGDLGQADGRDYARVDLGLRWMMTPTWYLHGGYSYRWQDLERDPSDADDNVFFLGFGYEGLRPPRADQRRRDVQ